MREYTGNGLSIKKLLIYSLNRNKTRETVWRYRL